MSVVILVPIQGGFNCKTNERLRMRKANLISDLLQNGFAEITLAKL